LAFDIFLPSVLVTLFIFFLDFCVSLLAQLRRNHSECASKWQSKEERESGTGRDEGVKRSGEGVRRKRDGAKWAVFIINNNY
jgi:hypothetical protein